jgi:acetyl esterase/lipase
MASLRATIFTSLIRLRSRNSPTQLDLKDVRALEHTRFPLGIGKVPADVRIEKTTLADVPVEWVHAPQANSQHLIVYLHGGAYCAKTPMMHHGVGAQLAIFAQARVLIVDYRLAPEHPYPAAIEDVLAVYRALLSQGQAPQKMVLMGDSAGGGLAIATLLRARDEQLPMPSGVGLLSPWVDLYLDETPSLLAIAQRDPFVKISSFRQTAQWYAQDTPLTPHTPTYFARLCRFARFTALVNTRQHR